jgi:hypothetical protein
MEAGAGIVEFSRQDEYQEIMEMSERNFEAMHKHSAWSLPTPHELAGVRRIVYQTGRATSRTGVVTYERATIFKPDRRLL